MQPRHSVIISGPGLIQGLHSWTPKAGTAAFQVILPQHYCDGHTGGRPATAEGGIGIEIVDIHGAGQSAGQLLTETSIPPHVQSIDPRAFGASLRGSLAVTAIDRGKGEASLLADPLGGGIVWKYEHSGTTAYSADLRSLRQVLSLLGIWLRPSESYVAAYVIAGGGGFAPCSYQNVVAVEPDSYIFADRNGISTRPYGAIDYSTHGKDPSQGFSELWDDIRNTVMAAHTSNRGIRIAHLTGGADSRLVLSAAISLGIANDFAYFTQGDTTSPDMQISTALVRHYGLSRTSYSGLDKNSVAPTHRDYLLEGWEATDGITHLSVNDRFSVSDNIIVSGGYGELLRRFYAAPAPEESPLDWVRKTFRFRESPWTRFIPDAVSEAMAESVSAAWKFGLDRGASRSRLGEVLYATRRNRYFVGSISRGVSQWTPRIDPIYSPTLSWLPGTASDADIAEGLLIMRMIALGDPDLPRLPFDSPEKSIAYLRGHAMEPLEFRRGDSPYREMSIKGSRPIKQAWTVESSPTDRERARALKMSTSAIATFRDIRPRLIELITDHRSDAAELFDVKELRRVLQHEPTHRGAYRSLTSAYMGLDWYIQAKGIRRSHDV
jgi:hypothetical protein